MESKLRKKINAYIEAHGYLSRWRKVVIALACVVVFGTTYALILPAITMTKEVNCGLEEHQHSEACYAAESGQTEMLCSMDGLQIHKHTSGCEDADGQLICGYADFVLHTHDELCYDQAGTQICTLAEIKEHEHDSDCFGVESVLVCGQEEGGHQHTEACYTYVQGELSCDLAETEGHTHSEGCYELEDTDTEATADAIPSDSESAKKTLICEKEEEEPHTHSSDCYDWTEVLICEDEESEVHVHSADCYEEQEILTCDETEVFPHIHKENCFGEDGAWKCGEMEVQTHQHTEDCIFVPSGETEEMRTPICGLPEHQHGEECVSSESPEPSDTVMTAETGDMTVVVVAEPGILPEGTTLNVTPVEWEESNLPALIPEQDTSQEAAKEVLAAHLYEFSFIDKDGQPVEMEGEVSVTMTFQEPVASADSEKSSHWELIHITEEELENLSQAETTQIQTNNENAIEQVQFQSDDFSVCALLETRAKPDLVVDGITYIAVPEASVTVNQKDSEVTGAVGEILDVDIQFELGTTGDVRHSFYYQLPDGAEVPYDRNGILTDSSGKRLGSYAFRVLEGKSYLLLDIEEDSTNMFGQASFGVQFNAEGSYKFEGGPNIIIFPWDIDKSKLSLSKTASDAIQNPDGSTTWTWTIKMTNTGEKVMTNLILQDRQDLIDQGFEIESKEGQIVSSDPKGRPGQWKSAQKIENGAVLELETHQMNLPAGATYTYTYTTTLSKADADRAREEGISLFYDNTAYITTLNGTVIHSATAQIAYITNANIFKKDGSLQEDGENYVKWTIDLASNGVTDASGSPIWDTLNQKAYEAGELKYIIGDDNYKPSTDLYINGAKEGNYPLEWTEVDSLEDVSWMTDYNRLYYCGNRFYWPGFERAEGDTAKYGFRINYWTTYPDEPSQYGESMNQAEANFKGFPLGTTGGITTKMETGLRKELVSLQNDMTARWKVTLDNYSSVGQDKAFIWDQLPDTNQKAPKDTMVKLESFQESNSMMADNSGNFFWVFNSVEEVEEVLGIRITVTDTKGNRLDADTILRRGQGDPVSYIGVGYYSWGAWKIYPNLYGTNPVWKQLLAQAAAGTAEQVKGIWYQNDQDMDFIPMTEGNCNSYLPGVGTPEADFPELEGYTIRMEYATNCAIDASLAQKKRTNMVYYRGISQEMTGEVVLSADASYYMHASQENHPVQKSLGEMELLENGDIKLTYLSLLDNRYRTTMKTIDQWVDEISGVPGAYYVQDSLKVYRAQVHFEQDTNRWALERVGSVSRLDEAYRVDWVNTPYPDFLKVEQNTEGFVLTLDYEGAEDYYKKDPIGFSHYAADFKVPDQIEANAATKASFYLCYEVIIPNDATVELEENSTLRNTISAYTDGQLAGSSHADYALDAMELSKSIVDAPVYDNGYKVTFQLEVLMTDALKKLGQFSIVDTLSDTLNLDVKSIRVYGMADGVEGGVLLPENRYQSSVDGQTLTLLMKRNGAEWDYDRYKVVYQARLNGVSGDKVHYQNSALIPEINSTPQSSEETVIINSAGVVVEQAQVEIYKYDGDNTSLSLEGAEFVLVPLKIDVQDAILKDMYENGPVSQEEFNKRLGELGAENWDGEHSFTGQTDADGSLVFQASDGNAIYANQIYCLKELAGPDGYLLQNGGYQTYFMIYQSTSDQDGIIKTYLAPYVPNKGMSIHYQVPNYKGGFQVYKVSSYDAGEYLTGAEFTLYEDESCTAELAKGVLTEDKNGVLCYYFGGLEPGGTFYLKETKAPDGFILDNTVYQVSISADGTVSFSVDGRPVESEDNSLTVENDPSVALPETGGVGTFSLTAGGLALMFFACLMLQYKKRRREGDNAS